MVIIIYIYMVIDVIVIICYNMGIVFLYKPSMNMDSL